MNLFAPFCRRWLCALLLLAMPLAAAERLQLVTTVKPLALIAAQALGDRAEVSWLYAASQSPHQQPLRPSMLRQLAGADLVVWVGPSLEGALAATLRERPAQSVISFAELIAGPAAIERDSGGDGHNHSHDRGHDHDQRGDHTIDPHLWLQPAYAERLAAALRQRLGLPPRPLLSAAQLGEWQHRLGALQNRALLMPHRSLDYLTDFFGLRPAEALASAAGVDGGLRHQLSTLGAARYRCLLAERSEPDRRLQRFAEQLGRPLYSTDSLGAAIAPGDRGYSALIDSLVADLERCLSAR